MIDIDNIKIDFDGSSYGEIINYTMKRHHASLKSILSSYSKRILTLYDVYFQVDGIFLGEMHSLFSKLRMNLESHIVKEERSLFLKIKEFETGNREDLLEKIIEEISTVEEDNENILYILNEIKEATENYTYGTLGHTGYDKIYRDLEDLEAETRIHLEIERQMLFERIKNIK